MEVSRKIGRNKTRPRIWLEGKILAAAGFRPGNHYDIVTEEGVLKMVLRKKINGKRKVSGKGETAIVDILGKAIEEAFGVPVPAKVTVTAKKLEITIVPEEE